MWQTDDHSMEQITLGYFSNIFHSNGSTDILAIVVAIKPVVTDSMNRFLCQSFQADEVHRALKQMHPKKSPRPDGMAPLFYQHFWTLSSEFVTKAILDFLNFGIIPPKFNETYVILIPKIKNPTKITDYRPISLSNVISRRSEEHSLNSSHLTASRMPSSA